MKSCFLITGASRGIGLEFVRQLRGKGHAVLAAVRRPDAALALKDLGVQVFPLDLTDPNSIAGLGQALGETPIDVVINNAGVSSTSKSVMTLDPEELAGVLRINAVGPMLVAKSLLPCLRRSTGRMIVSITSQLGSIANNTGGSSYGYRASKAALNQFNRCLANELSPEGFRCVAIHPGWVRTDMGGPNATLSVEDSVTSMLKVIGDLSLADSGKFLNYDGVPLPW